MPAPAAEFDVRAFGATGDGATLDSPAINAAIDAARRAGGGTVRVPAGRYLCFTLRLCSRLALRLEAGAVLVAARPAPGLGAYDPPEPNEWGDRLQYQDFGHSHWRNSLLWGDGLEHLAIEGPGLIDGAGLDRDASYPSTGPNGTVAGGSRDAGLPPGLVGIGNKAIGLRRCRHVTLRGFSVLNGGHFALLATGCDDLVAEDLRIDTNRDGLDLDGCRRVRVIRCVVNSPNDDAIVLKTSYALGAPTACEDVLIEECTVSGFDVGSVLDGSRRGTLERAPDRDGPTGRIKIGTETNGDVRRITIRDCTFERSRGLAIESVDGAIIEDVVASGLGLREVTNSVLFLRLGCRARGPAGTAVGAIRRVRISGVSADAVDGRFPLLLAGLPGHPIEDVEIDGLHLASQGGISLGEVAAQPDALVNAFFLRADEPGVRGPRDPFAVPERARAYPEPSMFGLLPAALLYARHVARLTVRDLAWTCAQPDDRPLLVLDDVRDVTLTRVHAAGLGGPACHFTAVHGLSAVDCAPPITPP